jgi:hypothetical protein
MRIGEVETGIPFSPEEGRERIKKRGSSAEKRMTYTKAFDRLLPGQSFIFEGTPAEIKGFRSALRSRNLRYRERDGILKAPQFDWDYESVGCIRVWRIH